MHNISLNLTKRDASGKKVRDLRKQGVVPSVVYGAQAEPYSTQSAFVETTKVVREAGRHTPVTLNIEGKKQLAIIKDIDMHPVKHTVRHIAFHAINQNDVITTDVPIVLIGLGESAAERAGLIVLQAIESVEIKAKPASLPESLEISIAHLETYEDRITLADINLPEGVEYNDAEQDLDLVVASVYEPAALEAANDAAAGTAEIDDVAVAEEGAEAPAEEPAAE